MDRQPDSPSSTLAVVNPVITRLRAMMTTLSEFIMTNGDEKQRRMQRVMQIVTDEAMDELAAEADTGRLTLWLMYTARMTEWAATGDLNLLPDELLPFACHVEGLDYNAVIAKRNRLRYDYEQETMAIDGIVGIELEDDEAEDAEIVS